MTEPDCRWGRKLLSFGLSGFSILRNTVERVLVPAFADLPARVREQHDEQAFAAFRARASVLGHLEDTRRVSRRRRGVDRDGHGLALGTRTLLFAGFFSSCDRRPEPDVVSDIWQGTRRVASDQSRAPVAALDAHRGAAACFLPGGGDVQDERRFNAGADSGDDGWRSCVRGGALHRRHVRRAANQSLFSHVRVRHSRATQSRRALTRAAQGLARAHVDGAERADSRARQPPPGKITRSHRLQRFALIASAFVMALLGLGVSDRWRSRATTIAAALALLVWYVVFHLGVRPESRRVSGSLWDVDGERRVCCRWSAAAAHAQGVEGHRRACTGG